MHHNQHWFLCPSCKKPLSSFQRNWRCENGHVYDQAKEGYVNLLLAHHKKSKQPGDNKAMVGARRAFLSRQHYAPLADEIVRLIKQVRQSLVESETPFKLFDAGCGEGYYLNHCLSQLAPDEEDVIATGIDISKFAIQKASKHIKSAHFAVASSFDIPLADNSQHVALQVFAPSSADEIHRILIDGGTWICVNPAEQHLNQLKQFVYKSPQQHRTKDDSPRGFILDNALRVTFEIELEAEEHRADLLMMTPFYWQIGEEQKQLLLKNLSTVTADFDIRVFRNHAN